MGIISDVIFNKEILEFKGITWENNFEVFINRPKLNGIIYPIISEEIPENKAWFFYKDNLKPAVQFFENDKEKIIKFILNLMEMFEEIENEGYKFFVLDPKSIYCDENLKPYIFLYYPIFNKNDLVNLSIFNMPITLRSKNSDFKNNNSYLLAELFAQLNYGKDYKLLNNFRDKKSFARYKLIDEGKFDLVKWFEKSLNNYFNVRDSKRELVKSIEKMKKRKSEDKKIGKIKRAFRTYEGTKKLKVEDDYFDNTNQDSNFHDVYDNKALFAVMDGVSTSKVGDGRVASNIVKEVIKKQWEKFKNEKFESDTVKKFFKDVIKESNEEILRKAQEISKKLVPGEIMASTLVMAIIYNDNLYICSVGDSNIYLISEEYFTKLNIEHNVKNLKLLNKEKINGDDSSLTEYIGKYKLVNGEIVCDEINFFYSETKVLDGETLLISSDGVLDYWEGYNQEEKEEKFFSFYLKTLKELKTLKATSQRIISILDLNEVNDNVTLYLVSPEFFKKDVND